MISSSTAYQDAITGKARRIYIKAAVDISDPDKIFLPVQASPQAPWSKPAELHDKVFDSPWRYGTNERGRWLLDGSYTLFPDDYAVPQEIGYAGAALSDEDGYFSTAQYVDQPFSNLSILQAFAIQFSEDPADGVASDFVVEVLQNGAVYFSETVTGNTDSYRFFEGFTVYDPTDIRITVTRWSLPGRRVRVVEIAPGFYMRWTGKDLSAFSARLIGDFSCLTLPYGTLNLTIDNHTRRFEPRKKDSIFLSIEERQGVETYIGVKLPDSTIDYKPIGIFYQAYNGWTTSDNGITINWSLVDILGLIANRTFLPPATLPTTLSGWIGAVAAQLGESFKERYHVDPDYAELPVTANSLEDVTGVKCGDIVRWACMATGTWPRADAETGDLTAEPLWSQGNKVTLRNLEKYPTMKANESLAALIFNLADGNGTQLVVSGNSTSSEKTVTVSNPFLHDSAQALAAARNILACYGGNIIETTGRGDPSSEIGDVATVWLDESSATTARIKNQTFQLSGGVLRGCNTTMLQADGSYLWTGYAIIREDGTWTAPAGVHQLRVVIGAGGQGGTAGQPGYIRRSGNLGNGMEAGYGDDGVDGAGGRIWYGVISCNEQQVFQIVLGAGGVDGALGGDTYFGAYSSEEGRVYSGGYTDIANGEVFARTGVEVPLSGSGDGGKGGQGGEPGVGYLKTSQYTPIGADPSVVNTHIELIITKEPGPGEPGTPGATGFVMVTWEIPEDEG